MGSLKNKAKAQVMIRIRALILSCPELAKVKAVSKGFWSRYYLKLSSTFFPVYSSQSVATLSNQKQ